jgi:hypothetical protein
MHPYRGRAAVDGQLVACAQPAAVVHSIDDTRDSEFVGILYRTAVLEKIGHLLVTGHVQFDMGLGGPIECRLTIESYFIVG